MNFQSKFWWLPFLLAGEWIDTTLTFIAGSQQEANSLMVWMWEIFGYGTVVIVKILTILLVVTVCWFLHHPKNPIKWIRKVFHVEMTVTLLVLLGVCIWNVIQLI